MRCTACGHLFAGREGASISVPSETPAPDAGTMRMAIAPAPPTPDPAAPVAPQPVAAPRRPSGSESSPSLLLADAGRPVGAALRSIFSELGYRVDMASDGTDAFRRAVASKPSAMVVSVHLAGLSGVAICEGVKGSPHLRDIRLALVGSDLSSDLFNRDTAMAYGADAFLDESMPEETLREAISALLDAPVLRKAVSRTSTPSPESEEAEDEEAEQPASAIGRLARLMLSDLRLYNPDRFERALNEDKLLQTFRDELGKGREIVDQRFPGLATRHDLLAAALLEASEREKADASAPIALT
jgi:CheY-like chemotaxis protein